MSARTHPPARSSLEGSSRPLFLGSHLSKKLNKARKALADNPCPETAHALAKIAWQHSKLLLLEMAKEKGL